jgi:nucleoside 2-deoxyribosyltransferase
LERIEQFRNQDQQDSETNPESKAETEEYDRPLIYTAGRMIWHNTEDSTYRAAVEEKQDIKADFLHPHDTYFDHGGDFVSGCVAEDIGMIDEADGIVAFFDETGQTGTMTELFHALRTDTPALVLFSTPHTIEPRRGLFTDPRVEQRDLPHPVGTVGQRLESELWFLINYLNGDSAQNPYGRTHQRDLKTNWDGTDVTTAAVSKSDESITTAISSWVENDLQSIDYPPSSSTPEEEIASTVATPGATDPEVITDE